MTKAVANFFGEESSGKNLMAKTVDNLFGWGKLKTQLPMTKAVDNRIWWGKLRKGMIKTVGKIFGETRRNHYLTTKAVDHLFWFRKLSFYKMQPDKIWSSLMKTMVLIKMDQIDQIWSDCIFCNNLISWINKYCPQL